MTDAATDDEAATDGDYVEWSALALFVLFVRMNPTIAPTHAVLPRVLCAYQRLEARDRRERAREMSTP